MTADEVGMKNLPATQLPAATSVIALAVFATATAGVVK